MKTRLFLVCLFSLLIRPAFATSGEGEQAPVGEHVVVSGLISGVQPERNAPLLGDLPMVVMGPNGSNDELAARTAAQLEAVILASNTSLVPLATARFSGRGLYNILRETRDDVFYLRLARPFSGIADSSAAVAVSSDTAQVQAEERRLRRPVYMVPSGSMDPSDSMNSLPTLIGHPFNYPQGNVASEHSQPNGWEMVQMLCQLVRLRSHERNGGFPFGHEDINLNEFQPSRQVHLIDIPAIPDAVAVTAPLSQDEFRNHGVPQEWLLECGTSFPQIAMACGGFSLRFDGPIPTLLMIKDAEAHVVGMAVYLVSTGTNGSTMTLCALYVKQGFRKKGIARAIIAELKATLEKLSDKPNLHIALDVARANSPAMRFYILQGFKQISYDQDDDLNRMKISWSR